MRKKLDKPFCRIPWTSIAVLPNGDVLPCVATNPYEEGGVLGNLKQQPFSEIWMGKTAQIFRYEQTHWDGNFLPCGLCQAMKIQKRPNRRDDMENKYSHLFDKWTNTESQIGNPQHITLLDIAFSSSCNLACTMCSSKYSTSWVPLEEELIKEGFERTHTTTPKEGYDEYEENFKSIFPYLENLHFLMLKGGEPLMSKRCLWFLEELVKRGISKQVTLIIITNGTIYNRQIVKLFENFQTVEAVVSLDGLGLQYKYIRGGDKVSADQVIDNIQNYRKIGDHVRLVMSPTIMPYNALQFSDLIKTSYEISDEVSFKNWVIEPVYQSIAALPKPLWPLVAEQMEISKRYLEEKEPENKSLEFFDYISDYMNERIKTFSIHLNHKKIETDFLRFTKIMNRQRGLEFHAIQPEFAPYFEGHEIQKL